MSTPSSSCRVDLRAGALPPLLPITLAGLAAAALAASAVPIAVGVPAWCGAVALTLRQWRRRPRVATLTATTPDRLLIGLCDGTEVDAVLRGWRALGPLLWIDPLPAAGRMPPLLVWQPGLQMNAARRLRRALAAMHPAGDASV